MVLLAAGASLNKEEFVTPGSRSKLTDNIQSQDMRSRLIEFCLDKMDYDPIELSFTEQVLLAANRRLMQELSVLHKRIEKLTEQPQKQSVLTDSNKAKFFEERLDLREKESPENDRSQKRSKMSDID